jgi:dUTP pyrophosphatase
VVDIPLKRLDTGDDLPVPAHAHDGDAGVDLRSSIDLTIRAGGHRALVPTGVAIAIPRGFAGFVQPRSGLALHHGITCLNTPGLIDAGYRGELKVLLVNTDPEQDFTIHRGDRIAQLVVQAVEQVRFLEVDDLDGTARGEGGFGHTGRT